METQSTASPKIVRILRKAEIKDGKIFEKADFKSFLDCLVDLRDRCVTDNVLVYDRPNTKNLTDCVGVIPTVSWDVSEDQIEMRFDVLVMPNPYAPKVYKMMQSKDFVAGLDMQMTLTGRTTDSGELVCASIEGFYIGKKGT